MTSAKTKAGISPVPLDPLVGLLCPKCGGKIAFILNQRMDDKYERLPVCHGCRKAFRDATLGWVILADEPINNAPNANDMGSCAE